MAETGQTAEHWDFFISRAGEDAAIAGTIRDILEAAGYKVLLQNPDFANHNFMERMHAGLKSGAKVIALLSPDYLRKDSTLAEALNRMVGDPLNREQRVIVLRVRECMPDGLLAGLAFWDLVPIGGDVRILRDVVLDAVKCGPRKETASTQYWHPPQQLLHPAITPVPNFTGRADDLAKLDAALWAETSGGGAPAHIAAITQTAAVHGLGGIGKSVLARHYAYENRERYSGVWSFAAETATGIEDGLIELGAHRIPVLDKQENRAAAAREALRLIESGGADKPWLLIYDNIETPETLNGLTPRSGAHILITTRWHRWQGRAAALELGKFSEAEAVDFLLKATGRRDRDGAARLAEALGWLPLALDHAAAFCFDGGMSFDAYKEQLADWLNNAPEGADYSQAVFATFNLAIEKAAAEEPMAEKLMGLLAFMAPDDFPRDIIPEEVIGIHALTKAIMALRKLSLIAVKDEAEGGALLSVHRLVQHVMRARLDRVRLVDDRNERAETHQSGDGFRNAQPILRNETSEKNVLALAALAIVADSFHLDGNDPGDVRNWPACERLLPHAMMLLPTRRIRTTVRGRLACFAFSLVFFSRVVENMKEPKS